MEQKISNIINKISYQKLKRFKVSKPKITQYAKFYKNADVRKTIGFFSKFYFYQTVLYKE